MENASKALIIAGAILLAIVIISLGLIVVNNTRNTVDTANLSEQEIQSFNAKFTAYEGENISGSRVNSLIQQVISTNQAIADDGGNNFIAIGFPSISNKYAIITYKVEEKKICYMSLTSVPTSSPALDNGNFSNISTPLESQIGLSVVTNASYTVKITNYTNGMIKGIKVTKNS